MSTPQLELELRQALEQFRDAQQYRERRAVDGAHGVSLQIEKRRCISFCSNDYLGLAADPRVAAAAAAALTEVGTGSGAAALVSGYNREHQRLEEALAEFTGRPRCLLFSSGWAANLGVLRALLGRADTLVGDELNHASLIDGGRLSGARYVRVPHCDVSAFGQALAAATGRTLLATDGVFSMDGDCAPLGELAGECATHGATLMVDDAHGFGVLGAAGRGSLSEAGVAAQAVPIYVATLGKALGVSGAFVAGSESLIEYLIQRARTWVFSTAPPPAMAAAARAALAIAAMEPERAARVRSHARRFSAVLKNMGLAQAISDIPIQPVIVGSEKAALALSALLYARGFWVTAIRPPTVPAGTARLRVTFSAAHSEAQVDALGAALGSALEELKQREATSA